MASLLSAHGASPHYYNNIIYIVTFIMNSRTPPFDPSEQLLKTPDDTVEQELQ